MAGVELPAPFVRNVHGVYGAEKARAWLDRLPGLVADQAAAWSLSVGEPYPLTFSFVAPSTRADGTPAVLKLVPAPNAEQRTEAAVLRLAGGEGAVRLLEADHDRGALLLERAEPGELLTRLHERDDYAATLVAAEVGRRLHRPVPAGGTTAFPTVEGWAAAAFGWLRAHHGDGAGPLPADLIDRGEREHAELVASSAPPVLLHGDLHHDNVLSSGRGWLATDPKGVLGEPAYEAGALLRNPPGFGARPDAAALLARRVPLLAEAYGVGEDRVRAWGRAHNVVSVIWSLEGGEVDTGTLAVVAALAG